MSPDSKRVTLYTYALSPFGMKVYWALVFKGIPFDLVYVHPVNQKEIAFTGQKVVPVLEIDKDWKQDSREACLWLETLFPTPSFAGDDEKERARIIAADEWITRNLIALFFRLAIDRKERRIAFNNSRKLAEVLRSTSGGIPWAAQFFWSIVLSRVDHVRRSSAPLDPAKSIHQLRSEIILELEQRLAGTGFVAATREPSFADLTAFAQVLSGDTIGIEGGINSASSPVIASWMSRMKSYFPAAPRPELIPHSPALRSEPALDDTPA